MTKTLAPLQKALNKQIKERHCPNFKSFTHDDFKKNKDAIELLHLYEQVIKVKSSIGTSQVLSQEPIWKFRAKVNEYINKQYPLGINNIKPLPAPSAVPKEEQHKSVEEFTESMKNPNANKALREQALNFVENYNSIDHTKQVSFSSDFITPLIIKNIKELFGINDEYMAKKLIHLNYTHSQYLDEYKEKIKLWSSYCEFVSNLIDFIQSSYPEWDKMSKKRKKEILTLHDILKNTYFKKNPEKLLEVENFLDNYGLNQKKTAKKEKLISFKFPKMTSNIADKLLDISSKNKFPKK